MLRNAIVLMLFSLLVSGCAMKRYETRWEPYGDTEVSDLSGAVSTCVAEANMAASDARRDKVSSQSSGGGFTAGFANAMSASIAEKSARDTVMTSCMNAYGFSKRRICVSNC